MTGPNFPYNYPHGQGMMGILPPPSHSRRLFHHTLSRIQPRKYRTSYYQPPGVYLMRFVFYILYYFILLVFI